MNERIRELVKQAGGIYHNDDGDELTPALVGKGLEKFAELIIRECADLVMNDDNAFDVLKHFGVEL